MPAPSRPAATRRRRSRRREGGQHVAVAAGDQAVVARAGPCGPLEVRQQHVVPHPEQPRRRRRVLIGGSGASARSSRRVPGGSRASPDGSAARARARQQRERARSATVAGPNPARYRRTRCRRPARGGRRSRVRGHVRGRVPERPGPAGRRVAAAGRTCAAPTTARPGSAPGPHPRTRAGSRSDAYPAGLYSTASTSATVPRQR